MTDDAKQPPPRALHLEGGRYRFYEDGQGALCCEREGRPVELPNHRVVRHLFAELVAQRASEHERRHAPEVDASTAEAILTASDSAEDDPPYYSVSDWRTAVARGHTRLGYAQWVAQCEEEETHSTP